MGPARPATRPPGGRLARHRTRTLNIITGIACFIIGHTLAEAEPADDQPDPADDVPAALAALDPDECPLLARALVAGAGADPDARFAVLTGHRLPQCGDLLAGLPAEVLLVVKHPVGDLDLVDPVVRNAFGQSG